MKNVLFLFLMLPVLLFGQKKQYGSIHIHSIDNTRFFVELDGKRITETPETNIWITQLPQLQYAIKIISADDDKLIFERKKFFVCNKEREFKAYDYKLSTDKNGLKFKFVAMKSFSYKPIDIESLSMFNATGKMVKKETPVKKVEIENKLPKTTLGAIKKDSSIEKKTKPKVVKQKEVSNDSLKVSQEKESIKTTSKDKEMPKPTKQNDSLKLIELSKKQSKKTALEKTIVKDDVLVQNPTDEKELREFEKIKTIKKDSSKVVVVKPKIELKKDSSKGVVAKPKTEVEKDSSKVVVVKPKIEVKKDSSKVVVLKPKVEIKKDSAVIKEKQIQASSAKVKVLPVKAKINYKTTGPKSETEQKPLEPKMALKDLVLVEPSDWSCDHGWPMHKATYEEILNNIANLEVDVDKLKAAKAMALKNCLITDQVFQIASKMNQQDTRVEWIKYAYKYTIDIFNYSKLGALIQDEKQKDQFYYFITH